MCVCVCVCVCVHTCVNAVCVNPDPETSLCVRVCVSCNLFSKITSTKRVIGKLYSDKWLEVHSSSRDIVVFKGKGTKRPILMQ